MAAIYNHKGCIYLTNSTEWSHLFPNQRATMDLNASHDGRRRLSFEELEERLNLSASLVSDINLESTGPHELVVSGGRLYFDALRPSIGLELFQSSGTVSGSGIVADIAPDETSSYPGELTDVGGTLFFAAGQLTTGQELWKTDGTAAGTVLTSDLNVQTRYFGNCR